MESIVRFVRNSRGIDNFRISNMLAPFAVYFPFTKAITPVFIGCSISVIIYLSKKLSITNEKHLNIYWYAVIWFCMLIFCPWENLFIRNYALNYFFAAVLTLFAILLALKLTKKDASKKEFVFSLIVAILAGGWHEGFAVPTLAGLCFFIISRRWKLPSKFYVFCVVYFLSTLFFVLSPGTFRRAAKEMGGIAMNQPIEGLILLGIILLFISVCSISEPGRRIIKKTFHTPICIIGLGIIPIGYLMGLLTESPPRCYFWPNLVGVIILVSLISNTVSFNWRCRNGNIICCLTYGICVTQSLFCIACQDRLYKEDKEILHLLKESERGMTYFDIRSPNKLSWIYRDMPVINIWRNDWQYMAFYWCLGKEFCVVLPTELENLDLAQLCSHNNAPNFLHYKNYLISENNLTSEWSEYNLGVKELRIPHPIELPLEIGGYKKGTLLFAIPFFTKPYLHKDNKIYPDTLLYYEQR